MEFERDVDRLSAFFATRALGEMLPHGLIAAVAGNLEYPSPKYYAVVNASIAHVRRSHGRCVECVQGRGYAVLHPHQHRGHAAKFVEQGKRRFGVASEVLGTVNGPEARLVVRQKAAIDTITAVAGEVQGSLLSNKLKAISIEVSVMNKRIDKLKAEGCCDDASLKLLIRERDMLKHVRRRLEHGHA